ncbi:MAG: hypothetical protein COU40_01275 [Candidatus Moranbacteria bacterium CG10_big_fil_rev_8_21_14_0_10_35_21]|nr:MAG: hypothetical protein COU40_01275 [Candidatus Moranbacteria bacterium CG10_big_fil_rev_8_21_14_0_10_35_21]PJA88395.1 MAG: hypothetical protein CO139_03380 [Candidatus Moranbacteria bacterium CG_4_9_14_3_um_filter_36_9]
MKNLFKTRTFLISAGIALVAFLVLEINSQQLFQSNYRILAIPKDEKTARNLEIILGNLEEIPMSLSFYEKMLELNPDIEDASIELTPAKRKKIWNEKIATKRIKKSAIIEMSLFDQSQWQAEILSRQTVTSLTAVASRYYNIQTELSLRIIDGPIISRGYQGNIGLAVLEIIISSFAFGLIVTWSPSLLKKIKFEKKELTNFFAKKNIVDEDVYQDFSFLNKPSVKPAKTAEKKSLAPSNLPVEEVIEEMPMKEVFEIPTVEGDFQEATPGEVKERLNKLLKGGL